MGIRTPDLLHAMQWQHVHGSASVQVTVSGRPHQSSGIQAGCCTFVLYRSRQLAGDTRGPCNLRSWRWRLSTICSVSSAKSDGGPAVTGYRPMTLAALAGRLGRTGDGKVRWKLVWEFLEEYRWELADVQLSLLQDEPSLTGDERWDTLLAALAEHLAAGHDAAPPQWADLRVLRRPWFPAELEIQRAEALVWAPAAFRKHGVYLSARDLEAA
jgi:hypothetical protein